jgi:hypothetical protein
MLTDKEIDTIFNANIPLSLKAFFGDLKEFKDSNLTQEEKDRVKKYYDSIELNQLYEKPNWRNKLLNPNNELFVNDTHQIDLLFMPAVSEYSRLSYLVTIVDMATKYKAAFLLESKKEDELIRAIKGIYENDFNIKNNFKYPIKMLSDAGSEFSDSVKKFLHYQGTQLIKMRRGFHLKSIEAANKLIAQNIFKRLYLRQLKTLIPDDDYSNMLSDVLIKLNNRRQSYGFTSIEAQQMVSVPYFKKKFKKDYIGLKHPIGTIVRRLLQRDEYIDPVSNESKIERRRATDILWSPTLYEVYKIHNIDNENEIKEHYIRDIQNKEPFQGHFNYWSLKPININLFKIPYDIREMDQVEIENLINEPALEEQVEQVKPSKRRSQRTKKANMKQVVNPLLQDPEAVPEAESNVQEEQVKPKRAPRAKGQSSAQHVQMRLVDLKNMLRSIESVHKKLNSLLEDYEE